MSAPAIAYGAVVAHELDECGIPVQEAARALGLTSQAFGRRLHGLRPFRVDELAAVAELVGRDLVDLVLRAHQVQGALDGEWRVT